MNKINLNMKNRAAMVALFAATMMLSVSCGGRNSNKQSGDASETKTETKAEAKSAKGGAKLKDVSESNWQAVVKSNFGVDLAMPDGWTFKEVYSPNKVNNLKLFLNIGGSTTGEAEAKRIFEITKALSPQGNYKASANWEAETVSAGDVINDISEVDNFKDSDVEATWAFTYDSKMILANVYMRGEVLAEYTFTINSTKP